MLRKTERMCPQISHWVQITMLGGDVESVIMSGKQQLLTETVWEQAALHAVLDVYTLTIGTHF